MTSIKDFPPEAEVSQALTEKETVETSASTSGTNGEGQLARRLVSLDAFRGLTILGMLLVNNIALDKFTPQQLVHAPWNGGVHFADLVFPWFLLAMGIAIPFSVASRREKGIPVWRGVLRIFGRTIALVLLGWLVDSSIAKRPDIDFGGILQLLGMAYLVGAFLYSLPLSARALLAAIFLLGHWAAIRLIPVPGMGAGVFTESSNLINYLNQTYLAPLHLQGIISVIPTSALVLIGTIIGDLMRKENLLPWRKTGALLVLGAALTITGWLWNLNLPFNKPVWTASYILYAAGLGTLLLALLYFIIDVKGLRFWALVLIVPGMNAITGYVLPILVKVSILQTWTMKMPDGETLSLQGAFLQFCIDHTGRIAGGWIYSLSYIFFWWLVLFYMYRRKIFLRV